MTEQEIKQKAIEIVKSYGYHEGEIIDYDYAVEMVAEALSK
jgi:hypothetical protein